MKYLLRALILIAITLLCSCATFQSRGHYPLLAGNSSPESWAAQQQWQITRYNQTYRLQAVMEVQSTSWTLAVMNSLGQRLFTVTSQHGAVSIAYQQSHPIDDLISDLVEAVQWSYWPMSDLQQQNAPDWRFKQAGLIREIYFSGILRASIDYQSSAPLNGSLSYDNKEKAFELKIESQQLK